MAERRVAAVEDNLLAQLDALAEVSGYAVSAEPDVGGYWSELAFPLFNVIGGGRFTDVTRSRRTAEVLAPYVERALPFLWWATPSTMPDEQVLLDAEMACERIPGMYVELSARSATPAVEDLTLDVVAADDPRTTTTTAAAFGMPRWTTAEIARLVALTEPGVATTVIAHLHGQPVAVGTLWVSGDTAGLYSIGTVEEARGRGVGAAVTSYLMDLGANQGCTHAVLHASAQGRPVYERLGFETVCDVPQYVWVPGETT